MSFWSDLVGRIRGIFGRGRAGIPPLPPPIKAMIEKKYLNVVWGHTIYKGIKNHRPSFNIPRGMKTLEDFIDWGKKLEMEMTEKRGQHPLALEVYCQIVLDNELTSESKGYKIIRNALSDSITELYPTFPPEILDWMEWGVESAGVDEEADLEAVKRFSRDGENFRDNEYDISNFVEQRIRSMIR